jgi:hypothetical protein
MAVVKSKSRLVDRKVKMIPRRVGITIWANMLSEESQRDALEAMSRQQYNLPNTKGRLLIPNPKFGTPSRA